MENKLKYQKIFLMLRQEDAGYGGAQEPSGYVKIEVRDGKGKLSVMVQNLKEGKIDYRIYILKLDEKQALPVRVGVIPLQRGKGELQWEFNPDDVAMMGSPIEEFNTAVVLVEYKDRENTEIICPLAAYKDKEIEWRDKVKEALYPVGAEKIIEANMAGKAAEEEDKMEVEEAGETNATEEIFKKEDIFSKYTGGMESKYVYTKDIPDESIHGMNEEGGCENQSGLDFVNESLNSIEENIGETNTGKEDVVEANADVNKQEGRKLDDKAGMHTKEHNFTDAPPSNERTGFDSYRELMDKHAEVKKNSGLEGNAGNCAYKNSSFCTFKGGNKGYNPCMCCYMRNEKKTVDRVEGGSGNIEKLRESLNKYFEVYDPFHSGRRDYKWWKIGSPVYMNNALYQCNIKTPLLFNPRVIMAHFKYRHLVMGIFTDRVKRKEYVVCGIPSVYGVDDRPFGDMCRWVQLEGYRPRYGAFGYWLVCIDPKTGKLLSLA